MAEILLGTFGQFGNVRRGVVWCGTSGTARRMQVALALQVWTGGTTSVVVMHVRRRPGSRTVYGVHGRTQMILFVRAIENGRGTRQRIALGGPFRNKSITKQLFRQKKNDLHTDRSGLELRPNQQRLVC